VGKGHSQAVECRGRDKSRHRKQPRERRALTSCQAQRKEQGRTQNETERARDTHVLWSTKGCQWSSQDTEKTERVGALTSCRGQMESTQDTERIRAGEGNSQTARRRERDKSRHREKWSGQVLTHCRTRERKVRTQTDRASEVNSRPVEHRGRDMPGYRMKPRGEMGGV
jgi:hypothetical protein